jgi:hypothetical protein
MATKRALPSGGRENTIFVKSDLAASRTFRIRPLLRPIAFQAGHRTQAADIEVATTGAGTVFIENRFGIGIWEKAIRLPA